MKKKKNLKLDVLKVESFVLNNTKNIQGGTTPEEPIYTFARGCHVPSLDTSNYCCVQNDNS